MKHPSHRSLCPVSTRAQTAGAIRVRWIVATAAVVLVLCAIVVAVWVVPTWLNAPDSLETSSESDAEDRVNVDPAEGGYVEFPTQDDVRERP